MDSSALVKNGHVLVRAMDEAGFGPRLAMWVHNEDTDTWKLWLVPPVGKKDRIEFYRNIAQVVSRNRIELGSMDAADTEMVLDAHPAIRGLKSFLKMPGLGSAHFAGNSFNGFYLPDGIILRADL